MEIITGNAEKDLWDISRLVWLVRFLKNPSSLDKLDATIWLPSFPEAALVTYIIVLFEGGVSSAKYNPSKLPEVIYWSTP